ncbi:MAG: glutaredoxin [Gammaproteobacteria bacterium]|jgi:glutaredoxin
MKYITNILKTLALILATFHVNAVTVQECVDTNTGEKTFQKACPPGTTSANTLKLQGGKASESTDYSLANTKITLYAVPECEACDIERQILQKYNATFTEVNIKDSGELQNKLKELIGGTGKVTVPVVTLNEKKIVGYDKASLISELEAAGFKNKEAEEKAKEDDTAKEKEVSQKSD